VFSDAPPIKKNVAVNTKIKWLYNVGAAGSWPRFPCFLFSYWSEISSATGPCFL
jgi:hypothetical protein